MKNLINIFILFEIINITFEMVPFWNFQSSAINLLQNSSEYSYDIVSRTLHSVHFRLNKRFYNDNGIIRQQNKLFLDGDDYGEVDFEDIESTYKNINNNYFVCPKGKYHVYYYKNNEKNYELLNFDNIIFDNWNLMCFYQFEEKYLFIAYLNSEAKFYQYDLDKEELKVGKTIFNGIQAFRWRTSQLSIYEKRKEMFAIIREGNNLNLKELFFDVQRDQEYNYETINQRNLGNLKKNYLASFKTESFHFYWITYDSASEFDSGYYNKDKDISRENIGESDIKINENKSPLVFFDSVTIEEMKFIFGNKYVYYKIKNDITNKNYFGIIDVTLNKVIFNTDENIKEFKPFSFSSMLAITRDSVYKICILRDGQNCLEDCSDNYPIFDTSTYNHCGDGCSTNFILKPNNICIDECDNNIYIIQKNYECWLCKDLNGENKYKLVGHSECLKDMPSNSYYVNEKLLIIACNEGLTYYDGQCVEKHCHENCNTCTAYSNDKNDQKCISCKNPNLFLQNRNCVDRCSENYFLNGTICQICDGQCNTCNINSYNCTSCKDKYYLFKTSEAFQKCEKCSENCKTCFKGEEGELKNCKSCDQNSLYKYLYNTSCLEKCPENTKKNEKNECVYEENSKTDEIMIKIFVVITAILLILIIFCFFKKYCWSKNSTEKMMDEINTAELIEK